MGESSEQFCGLRVGPALPFSTLPTPDHAVLYPLLFQSVHPAREYYNNSQDALISQQEHFLAKLPGLRFQMSFYTFCYFSSYFIVHFLHKIKERYNIISLSVAIDINIEVNSDVKNYKTPTSNGSYMENGIKINHQSFRVKSVVIIVLFQPIHPPIDVQ